MKSIFYRAFLLIALGFMLGGYGVHSADTPLLTQVSKKQLSRIIQNGETLSLEHDTLLNETKRMLIQMLKSVETHYHQPLFHPSQNLKETISLFQRHFLFYSKTDPRLGTVTAKTLQLLISLSAQARNPFSLTFYDTPIDFDLIEDGSMILSPNLPGMSKELIINIQQMFLELTDKTETPLYSPKSLTYGVYDKKMKSVIAHFQKKYMNIAENHWASGLFGKETYSYIKHFLFNPKKPKMNYSENVTIQSVLQGHAKFAMDGGPYHPKEIQTLQKLLRFHYDMTPTKPGVFDKNLKHIIIAFQTKFIPHSQDPLGIVGKETLTALYSVSHTKLPIDITDKKNPEPQRESIVTQLEKKPGVLRLTPKTLPLTQTAASPPIKLISTVHAYNIPYADWYSFYSAWSDTQKEPSSGIIVTQDSPLFKRFLTRIEQRAKDGFNHPIFYKNYDWSSLTSAKILLGNNTPSLTDSENIVSITLQTQSAMEKNFQLLLNAQQYQLRKKKFQPIKSHFIPPSNQLQPLQQGQTLLIGGAYAKRNEYWLVIIHTENESG